MTTYGEAVRRSIRRAAEAAKAAAKHTQCEVPAKKTKWECGNANCSAGFVTIHGYAPTKCPECGGGSFYECPEGV